MFWFTANYRLKQRNAFIEENAAILCDIQPDFHVLEIGFGPGVGLKKAAQYIKNGTGKIYGIDFSPAMVVEAINNLPQEIADEKIELVLGNAARIPYRDNTMDRIFHTNCYYFWPDVPAVARELFRVLKPGGFMATLLNLERVKEADQKGLLKYGKWQPEPYMEVLKEVGFQNVEMKSNVEKSITFESIFAHKPESDDTTSKE